MSRLNELKEQLADFPQYEELLYNKGFLITDDNTVSAGLFTESWTCEHFGRYSIWHDRKLPLYICDNLFMLGHAYNPYEMKTDEKIFLDKLSGLNGKSFWKYEADLTGVYVLGKIDDFGNLLHWSDCAGMLISYKYDAETKA